MNPHVRFDTIPPLDHPALVCAFQGWNDGGEAASVAARYLMERWRAEPFGRIDAEEFYDFQVNRPTVRLSDGVSRVIDWPHPSFAAASPAGRDVVFLTGPEPSVRWRTFTDAILDVCGELDVDLLMTLGGFLADVPHSHAVPVVGSARDELEAERLGLTQSRYEGATGIIGVLHDSANRAGITSVSLWAAVPHYLPVAPNPKVALALVSRACDVLGAEADTGPLTVAVRRWEREVARLLQENEELSEYASSLEAGTEDDDEDESDAGPSVVGEGADGPEGIRHEDIPSADALAAEVERYLKEQTPHEPGDEA